MDNFDIVEVPLDIDGERLFGVAYVPDDAGVRNPAPTVICAHGLNRSHEDMEPWARELARRGYFVYCPDFRGAAKGNSSGDSLAMSLRTQRQDLEMSCRLMSKRPDVDANNIFFMGHSMGAASAALATQAMANRIKGLMLLAPMFNVSELAQAYYPDTDNLPASCKFLGCQVGRAFLEAAHATDFSAAQAAYAGPVLIIQGADDTTASVPLVMQAAKTYRHARLELIGGVGHHFEGGAFKYAVKCLVGFLDEEADLADESGLDGDLNFGGGMGGMGGMGAMR